MGRWTIDKKLIYVKIHYFTYFGGIAALWPFIQVFGRQLGVSELNVGIIFTVAPIFGIVCNPLFGYVADKFRIKKKLFLVFIFLNFVAYLGFAFLPYNVDRHNNDIICDDSQLSQTSYPERLITVLESSTAINIENLTSSHGLDEHFQNKVQDFELTYTSFAFWYYAILVILSWICMSVVTSVADALCFQTLGEHHQKYGFQRQFGALGWGSATFLAGYLIDIMSDNQAGQQKKNYGACFYLVAILLIINLIVSYLWKVEEEVKSKSMKRDLLSLILQPRIAVFILACIVVGICTGLQWTFLYWYVEDLTNARSMGELDCDHKNWVKLLQGAVAAVQCFGGEVPFFYLSGWVIKKLGHVNCFSLVLGAFGVRFLVYSTLTNPWMILPVELFQGLTYGIFYATMASYAFLVSPPGTGATVQSIVAAAFEGIGVAIGSVLSGIFFEIFSGRMTFRFFGILAVIACLLHVIAMYFINAHSKLKEYQPPPMNQPSEKINNVDEEGREMQELKIYL